MFRPDRSELQVIFTATLMGLLIGSAYTYVAYLSKPGADGQLWLGAGIGASIACLISYFEIIFVGRPESKIRQLPFWFSLIIRAVVHLEIIYFSIHAWQIIYRKITGIELQIIDSDLNDTLMDLGFSMIIVLIIIFYMQMRLFIGSRTLRNLIVGRYSRPQLEERVFLILDLVGSTKLAQELGDVEFHKFLNRVFILADGPIHKHGGEVHSYVGDSVFATWPVTQNKSQNTRALKAAKDIDAVIRGASDAIERKFNTKPAVRIAIHKGPVVAGETGHRKRQITYLGNTVNLASRIESLTKTGIGPYLASREYLQVCDLPVGTGVEDLGEFDVKGAKAPIGISRVYFEAI